ncbi:MAG: glycoside hydrolase family 127 protein [Candidatus Hydrogenedentes bacterium]|nr:glycoside hydrolase family 127 protein [Candidatus Hydrogenedentota bacterium]
MAIANAIGLAAVLTAVCTAAAPAADAERGSLTMDSILDGQWRFDGELGRRIQANVDNWLLRAPDANPGLIEMFHRRDRHLPYDTPVPWAGEFAGKYLISAVQALRMSDDPRLEPHVASFVKALIACQADDGYLGPWPEHERLLGHWDLWGHYHCMLGLLMWHDHSGDPAALDCAIRAADCICDIYAEGARRPIDAGTPQINLAVLHVFGDLVRRTGNPRYRRLMQRIEEDMEKDGDWLRLGAKGVPYHQLPGGGTRWESLHIVQGIVELFRITGDERYKQAAISLWESIRDCDRHPSGAFSTHECAHGTIYDEGAIETCCSVAWEALTIDVLRLTGDARVADELELTTWNQVLAAQHPSGSWWTYDTPINGIRIPSFHHIRFQFRPGTPELNCCSVNAPRGLGMLSEWAVTQDDAGLAVNFYGPSTAVVPLAGGNVEIAQDTRYPVDGAVTIAVTPDTERRFTLKVRIPEWARNATVQINGQPAGDTPRPGTYLALDRTWRPGDRIALSFDMAPRHWAGQGSRHGRAAVFAGPLLLAFDPYYNPVETAALPAIDMGALRLVRADAPSTRAPGRFLPLALWKTSAADGTPLVLCDFAHAGVHGTDYVAWLPAANVPPAPVALQLPENGAVGTPGPVLFRWTRRGPLLGTLELLIARDPAFQDVAVRLSPLEGHHVVVRDGLDRDGTYYWKVVGSNQAGATDNEGGPRSFTLDPAASTGLLAIGEHGLMAAAPLDGDGTPRFGERSHEQGLTPAPNRAGVEGRATAFDGKTSGLRFRLPFFPDADYSMHAWVCPEGPPTDGMQQVFSAWCVPADDPLRVTLQKGRLSARIEAGNFYSTPGVPLAPGEWVHVAAVKSGTDLTLYINGERAQSVQVPEQVLSASTEIGVGFNPLFGGGEHFLGKLDDFAFYAEALSPEQVAAIYRSTEP